MHTPHCLIWKPCLIYCTHTHSFNGPLSRTARVSRYQKRKTNPDFTEARDSEWQWHQLGHMQVCTSLQPDNHASTPPLSFLQAGCPSCRPNNSVKALKASLIYCKQAKIGESNKSQEMWKTEPATCWKSLAQQRHHCETTANSSCLLEYRCASDQQLCFCNEYNKPLLLFKHLYSQ